MKERCLFYFVMAVVISILFIVSIVVHQFDFIVSPVPSIPMFILPLILIWIGWYFEEKGLLLASTILLSVVFIDHMSFAGIVGGTIPIDPQYAPLIKTFYVMSFVLLLATIFLGYFSYMKHECCFRLKPREDDCHEKNNVCCQENKEKDDV